MATDNKYHLCVLIHRLGLSLIGIKRMRRSTTLLCENVQYMLKIYK